MVDQNNNSFGFNDGLSQPSVQGVSAPDMDGPVDPPVRQGIILLGREGDDGVVVPTDPPNPNPTPVARPSWAIDGSFLAFRYLKQLVPEFDAFLEQTANTMDLGFEVPKKEVKDLLGARLVGRWKSGAPIQLAPLKDDPALAAPGKNQDFRFDIKSQERCPYAAHIRKTNPRGDLDGTDANGKFSNGTEIRRIIRRGITFGPEVTHQEKVNKKSSDDEKLERGLLFACYQSNLANGFHFIQQSKFPITTSTH
jgi:Dyp-type peroxidase family